MCDRNINIDSREGFDNGEYDAYLDKVESFADQLDEEDLYGDFEDDGQPSEYTEWMDFDPDC